MNATETMQISVLMSVYNGLPYLEQAVESILNQTLKDFEFIIIDDCSSDGSLIILERYAKQDKRINLIKNITRQGLGANLRYGVEIAKGEWVARIDADDIAMPERLKKQLEYVKNHPFTDVLGSYAEDIDSKGNVLGIRKCPLSHENIVKYIWTCPIIHPTAFIKKESILRAGSYGMERRRQDYALWFRCAAAGLKFANLSEPLIKYRFTDDYFKKNNLRALANQVKIGWLGCWQVKAAPIAYIGVMIPLIKGILPKRFGMFISKMLKKVDPRDK